MNFNLDVRLKQLESLEHYISSSRDKVQSIFDCLKWDANGVMKESQLIKCSIDPSHRVPHQSMDEHVRNCSLRREDYELNEDFLSEPLHDPNSSVVIDDHKKIEILSAAHRNVPDFKSGWNGQDPDPKTANRLLSTFSADERSALYTYAVTHTVGPPLLPEFNTLQPIKPTDKPLTYEELRKQERDAKRHRIKYKSVHTNRKSHTEVIREVIDGQMDMYMDWLVNNDLIGSKLNEPRSTNVSSIKSDDHSCDEQQRSAHSSVTDFCERSQSVLSKNSTHSGSSRSTNMRSHRRSTYELENEHNNHRWHADNNYKKYYDKEHSGIHNQNSRSRRSRERHDQRKYRSNSRHTTGRFTHSKTR